MSPLSRKALAFGFLLSLPLFPLSAAQAGVLHTADGVAVTSSGGCVTVGFEGDGSCVLKDGTAKSDGSVFKSDLPLDRHAHAVYFGFNQATLTPDAQRALTHLAHHLLTMREGHYAHHHAPMEGKKAAASGLVILVGHADSFGGTEYNEKLALKRAAAVRTYLVQKGVKPNKIEVRSVGKTEPHAHCDATLPRAALITCLQEDRRVEINVSGCDK